MNILDDLSPQALAHWKGARRIAGYLEDIDFLLIHRFLSEQEKASVDGDLLEVGAFHGKSAILVGGHRRTNERFFVCDVFGDPTGDGGNDRENAESYRSSRGRFEENYRRHVDGEVEILQMLSDHLPGHIGESSIRFAHIDGGHLYDQVKQDAINVKTFLNHDGIVVFDDFRAQHTPGVAAAVWGAVANDGLIPIALTEAKFYGTFSPQVAEDMRARIEAWLANVSGVRSGRQVVAGRLTLIVANPRIWTVSRRIRHILPPAISDRLRPKPPAHLGA